MPYYPPANNSSAVSQYGIDARDLGFSTTNPDNSANFANIFSQNLPVIFNEIYDFATTQSITNNDTKLFSPIAKKGGLRYTGNAVALNIAADNVTYDMCLYGSNPKPIQSITLGNPTVINCTNHGLATGQPCHFIIDNGPVKLNGRVRTASVINANQFSIAYDTTGAEAFVSGFINYYRAGNTGIYATKTTFSPLNIVWMNNLNLGNSLISGFGDYGIYDLWQRNLSANNYTLEKCAYAGHESLSLDGERVNSLIINHIGPGSSTQNCYGRATARSNFSPILPLSQAPASTDSVINELYVSNLTASNGWAWDTHGGNNLHIGHLITENVKNVRNIEHASTVSESVPAFNCTIGTRNATGVNPAWDNRGLFQGIDAVSSFGHNEISFGITSGDGPIKWHGFDNTIALPFANGGVHFVKNSKGVDLGAGSYEGCVKHIVYMGQNTDTNFSGNSIISLDAFGGFQDAVFAVESTSFVTVDNNQMRGSGYLVKAQYPNSLSYGANNTLYDTAEPMDAPTKTVCFKGSGRVSPLITLCIRGDTGAIVYKNYIEKEYTFTASKTGVGQYRIDIPSGLFNNSRIQALYSIEGAYYDNLITSQANLIQLWTYSDAARTVPADVAGEITFTIQGA